MNLFAQTPRFNPFEDAFSWYVEQGVEPKALLSEVERRLDDRGLRDGSDTPTGATGKKDSATPKFKRLRIRLLDKVRSNLPNIVEWQLGEILVLQLATRVVLVRSSKDTIRLVFLAYDFLSGDPVTDSALLATPWLESSREWIASENDADLSVESIVDHMTELNDLSIDTHR